MKAMQSTQAIGGGWLRAMLILALVFPAVPYAGAQDTQSKGNGATAAKPQGGPQEGIKVHGHWVIEVRNPDGTLVTHREFENSLQPPGASLLTRLLVRGGTPGTWSIVVFDGLCPVNPVGSTVCILVDSLSGQGATPQIFPTVGVVAFLPANKIELSGNFVAASAGAVTGVATGLGQCSSVESPVNCVIADLNGTFSGTSVVPPVAVQQGQIVQIKVTISFS